MPDPLLDTLQVGHLCLRNRIYSPGHAPSGFLENGVPGDRYARYHEEKAKGGLALTIIGGSSGVDRDSANVFGNFYAGGEQILRFYRDVSEGVHRHGAAILVQLTHLGRRSQSTVGDQLPTLSPSAVRERAHRSYPKPMDTRDIDRVIAAFGRAAALAKEGGLDGVEIAALAGHLIDQFWSRRTNHRTDGFGGSLENRLRFGILALQAVRAAVGDQFVVGLRMAGDEGTPGGLEFDECVAIASQMARTGLIDYLSIVYGSGNTLRELSEIMPGFGRPLGGHLELAGAIRKEVDIPIFHAGRIADVATARHALDAGFVDMVGMVRAHIADPHIVRKLQHGLEERIRPCVGASQCLSDETQCIHNPATGHERTIPQLIAPADLSRSVVVVGGGVAGLEAARVCAERGHDVTLYEAGAELGGQVRFAAKPQRQAEKHGIVGWLSAEIARLGVVVKRNTYAKPDDVLRPHPDIVIIATGGLPNLEMPGADDGAVISCIDALATSPINGRRTLIYDDDGGEQAVTTAEYLARGGEIVELVTPDRMPAQDVVPILISDYLRGLYAASVTITPDHQLQRVSAADGHMVATLTNAYTDRVVERLIDRVVVDQGTTPIADLYHALRAESINDGELDLAAFATGRSQSITHNEHGRYQLFRIGDAVSRRGIHAAIYDARRLCMNM